MLDDWIKKEKKSPWPWVISAQLSFNEKKYRRCLTHAQKALDLSPQCADAYFLRGRALEETHKFLDAANEYRAALLVDRSFTEAQVALDRVSAQLGDPVFDAKGGSKESHQ